MEQEDTGHRLEAGIVEGHPLGVALHELNQRTFGVVQPFVGLSEIGLGEINPHKCGLWQGGPDLMQGTTCASGNIKYAQAALASV